MELMLTVGVYNVYITIHSMRLTRMFIRACAVRKAAIKILLTV